MRKKIKLKKQTHRKVGTQSHESKVNNTTIVRLPTFTK